VEFNPPLSSATVSSVMRRRTSTTIGDAGEIGAGHSVTAFYGLVPVGQPLPDQTSVDPLKYQAAARQTTITDELLTVKLRYKALDGDSSRLLEVPVRAGAEIAFDKASQDFQFAAAAAAFGMKLRSSPQSENISWEDNPENRSTQFERRFRNLSCRVSHAR
jgi:Domain of unknown function (DUF3520)